MSFFINFFLNFFELGLKSVPGCPGVYYGKSCPKGSINKNVIEKFCKTHKKKSAPEFLL